MEKNSTEKHLFAKEKVIPELKRRASQLKTVEALCQVSSENPKRSGTFSAIFLLQEPNQFRFIGYRSFLGSTILFDLLLEGQKTQLYIPFENKVMQQSSHFMSKEMLNAFFGLKEARFLLLEEKENSYFYALVDSQKRFQQTIKVDKKNLWLQEQRFYGENGQSVLHITYDQYKKVGEYDWPYEVKITQPESFLHLIFQEVQINQPLEEEAFVQDIPEEVQQEN